ncbi:MAG: TOBE domain-containing protein [Woeseiaceae bacterium]
MRERPEQTTILNVLRSTVEEIHRVDAARALVRLVVGNQSLLAQVTNRSVARLQLGEGDRVFAQLKSVTVRH